MAAVTSAVLSVGSMAYKGFSQIDAGKTNARMAGRLSNEADQLAADAKAELEQNRLEALKVPMEIYDKANEATTLDGSTILEAAVEGDQRGVQATAGKIKATQDEQRSKQADTFAGIIMDQEKDAAVEGNRKGELVSEMLDERSVEKQLEADVLQQTADEQKAAGISDVMSAGVSAFSGLTSAFGGGAKGRLAQQKVDGGMTKEAALAEVNALGDLSNKEYRALISEGRTGSGLGNFMSGVGAVGKDVLGAISGFTGIGDGKSFNESGLAKGLSKIDLQQAKMKAKELGISIEEYLTSLVNKN